MKFVHNSWPNPNQDVSIKVNNKGCNYKKGLNSRTEPRYFSSKYLGSFYFLFFKKWIHSLPKTTLYNTFHTHSLSLSTFENPFVSCPVYIPPLQHSSPTIFSSISFPTSTHPTPTFIQILKPISSKQQVTTSRS